MGVDPVIDRVGPPPNNADGGLEQKEFSLLNRKNTDEDLGRLIMREQGNH